MTGAPSAEEYAVDAVSRDGTFVHVRAIRPDDAGRLRENFRRLSTESIRARYHGAKAELTAGEVAAMTEVDLDVHLGLVATIREEGRERIVGLGSCFVDRGTEPRAAEVAFTVRDDFQNRGIGTLLFEHLVHVARETGIEVLYADVLESNRRMLGIFRRSGLPLESEREGSARRITLDLRAA
ncbi:MAG: GNAT family N-acetyltransferase [Gemmatimonadota bacterium]|nr:GNAT family N-acetyltransferase [Gemmatimonadota bacterium]